jgi:nitrate/TMAO reductase-like tetraheme cytochrome c subunit
MAPSGTQPQPGNPPSPPRRRILRRLAVALLAALFVAGGAMAGMEYYTSRPKFCGSCHIMQPYYESWSADVHATKAGARCVDCHYAPGEQHTIKAKMRGLSQVVTYFSGRAGGRRPRPHVQDASCLREGCHKIPDFIDKPYAVKDVKFVHNKHLQPDTATTEENRRQMTALQQRLAAAMSPAALEQMDRLTVQLEDPNELEEMVRRLLEPAGQAELIVTGVDYVTRVRRDIRYRQVADNLRCTTCHAFTGGPEHFTTRTSSCYACHFTGQPFNTDTGECLKCHNPPQIQVPVHSKTLSETVGEARKAGTMDHSLIIEKKVDCRSCHADLVKGTGRVSRDRCAACHDLAKYFTQFDEALNPQTVALLHDKHVADLYALCTDCHDPIQHQLKSKNAMQMAGGFLEPIRENCAHCHPNHHLYQVEMLIGQPPPPIPPGGANAMFGSRVNCLGCHTRSAVDMKGTAVIEATKQACVICHSQDYQQLFDQWISALDTRQREVVGLLEHVEGIVKQRGGREQLPAEALKALESGGTALNFVGSAKGIHNRNYALSLLDYSEGQLQQVLRLIGEPVPALPSRPALPAQSAPTTRPIADCGGVSVYHLANLVKCPMDPDAGN